MGRFAVALGSHTMVRHDALWFILTLRNRRPNSVTPALEPARAQTDGVPWNSGMPVVCSARDRLVDARRLTPQYRVVLEDSRLVDRCLVEEILHVDLV